MTNIRTRIERLEAEHGFDEVTLEELVAYSYTYETAPDPEFEVRLARSRIGRMIMEVVREVEARSAGSAEVLPRPGLQ